VDTPVLGNVLEFNSSGVGLIGVFDDRSVPEPVLGFCALPCGVASNKRSSRSASSGITHRPNAPEHLGTD
jgi:hypothetical protein